MSTQPDDGFPDPADATTNIRYLVGGRFSKGPITSSASPGPVVGELIVRLSKLYSALTDLGSNLGRAVEVHPFFLADLAHRASVDLIFEPHEGPETTIEDPPDSREALSRLAELAKAADDDVVELAQDSGGAVATAYRQLASLLASQEIDVDFFLAVDRKPVVGTFVQLSHERASRHADALSSQEVLRVHTATLTGDLDSLAARKGTFTLLRPSGLSQSQDDQWRNAVPRRQSVEGTLSDEAATDIRRLGAWSSRVTVEVELTYLTAPKKTSAEEIEGTLLRVVSVQPELDDEADEL